ncbi:hypothetical protein QN277_004117 [Acacia crassicarpa]|uniref:Uncharacterized protein n=1 Tax=Acacia crassicarpa TaxID=499986 RepID=A0AAE1IZQ3_9FABA|nr:hypothetical protein QN277_004117 [Acacia crassicarpa]
MVKSSSCCEEQVGLKKGTWTPEEDQKLMSYIQLHGHASWSSLPAKAGLRRCGKSCRLRWINYLRPDIKRGNFSLREDQTIVQLHALLGNRWSVIAHHLPQRTDNEIKNHWNTHLKKRLIRKGINPTTHKPLNDAANLSHMAQWETARLEAESRQVKEYSKLQLLNQLGSSSSSSSQPSLTRLVLNKIAPRPSPPACLDVLKVWQNSWSSTSADHSTPKMHSMYAMMLATDDLESPASKLSFPDNVARNSKCPNSNFWLMNKNSLSSTTTTPVSNDNGIMEGARYGEPCGNKEQSRGDDDIMAAMGALFPSVWDDWEAVLDDLVNGWPRSTAFPVE